MRIIETIKWLLNHPPVDITSNDSEINPCDYCGKKPSGHSQIWQMRGTYSICAECQKKVYDKILKRKKRSI